MPPRFSQRPRCQGGSCWYEMHGFPSLVPYGLGLRLWDIIFSLFSSSLILASDHEVKGYKTQLSRFRVKWKSILICRVHYCFQRERRYSENCFSLSLPSRRDLDIQPSIVSAWSKMTIELKKNDWTCNRKLYSEQIQQPSEVILKVLHDLWWRKKERMRENIISVAWSKPQSVKEDFFHKWGKMSCFIVRAS